MDANDSCLITVTARYHPADIAKVKRIAAAEDRKVAAVLRRLLRKALTGEKIK